MFLLKLLGLKWSGCNLILSTLNQLYTAVVKNCQAQKSTSSTFMAMIMKKKIYIFHFPRCVEEYIFAGLVYFIVALSSQNLKSSI